MPKRATFVRDPEEYTLYVTKATLTTRDASKLSATPAISVTPKYPQDAEGRRQSTSRSDSKQ